jgi:hypothetical protein
MPFTIRHIESNGHESVHAATFASFDPGVGASSCGEKCIQSDTHRFNSGRVYVMNDGGKTVATYDL